MTCYLAASRGVAETLHNIGALDHKEAAFAMLLCYAEKHFFYTSCTTLGKLMFNFSFMRGDMSAKTC